MLFARESIGFFFIETGKYTVYWYWRDNLLSIKDKLCLNQLLKMNKSFDLSFFAELKDKSKHPCELEIVSSSADFVDRQVERLLGMKAFA